MSPFMGPLIPLFWTSGDISSGFQSQSGQPYSSLQRLTCYTFPEIHLWCDTCRPLGGQHGSWAVCSMYLPDWLSDGGGVSAQGVYTWGLSAQGRCLPRGCLLGGMVSAYGGICPVWGCLPRGVSALGVSALGVYTSPSVPMTDVYLGGVCLGGVSAQGRCLPRGLSA